MGSWRFRNVTKSNAAFWPLLPSIDIANAQPCELATFSGRIVDEGAAMNLDPEDEVTGEYAADNVTYVKVFAGDVSRCVLTDMGRSDPRVYEFTARDYTARLDDTVIDSGNRLVEESATDRVNWIMGFTPSRDITNGVDTIATVVDEHDYSGMTRREALSQVANQLGAVFYVDFDKELHFFTTGTTPAPFDLGSANPPTSYPFWDFQLEQDSTELANAVYVKGDGISLWRTDAGSITTYGRQERALVDQNLWKTAKAEKFGDRVLALYSEPMVAGSLVTNQPGLEAGQTVHITYPSWGIDDDYVVTSISVSMLAPNPGGEANFHIGFADRILCKGTPQSRARDLADQVNDDTRDPVNDTNSDDEPGPSVPPHEHDADYSPIGHVHDPAGDCCDEIEGGVGLTPTTAELLDTCSDNGITIYQFSNTNGVISFGIQIPMVTDGIWPNIGWPDTNCGIGLGGWGPGFLIRETWYKFDHSGMPTMPAEATGERWCIPAGDTAIGTAGTGGQATLTNRRIIGVAYAAPTGERQFTPVAAGPIDAEIEVDVPRSMFESAGDFYLVEAAGWEAERDTFLCDAELAQPLTATGGYGPSGSSGGEGNSGHYYPSSAVGRAYVGHTTSGYSNWVSGTGAVNGANLTYSLPDWDGLGTPEVRVGAVILGSGHYTWDGVALTVTLNDAPPVGADVRFRYRVAV